ncbi:MAG TPA: hypothetical protein VIQ30_24415 [Pseudonocardia sp.]
MTMVRTDSALPLIGPPGFPTERYVERLTHPHMATSREFRYEVCRANPIMFGLHYLGRRHMSLNGVHALSEFHVELADSARRWALPNLREAEVRDAWVQPRRAAKTTWMFLILPLWAMAYRHRRYIALYSDTVDLVGRHLATLRQELRDNDRLRRDHPTLCEPMRDGRKAMRDNSSAYLAANGTMIEAKGMNSATLGVKWRELRPDTILADEIEPQESKWSADQAAKRLRDFREGILEINDEAVVQITGTTVMHGSIIHQITEGEDWVATENIRVHHTKGILSDPVTGDERSCWPQKWNLEALREKRRRNPRNFAKNYDNAPVGADGAYWTQEHITYAGLEQWLTDRILVIDPAAKSGRKNDTTGIGKVAYAASLRQVVVEDVIGVRLPPDQLRARVHATCQRHRIKTVLVDVTNGGTWVLNGLQPMPPGVRVIPVHISGRSKLDRIAELHDRYLRLPAQVVHAQPISNLESLMCSYPNVRFDDQLDVVALAAQWFIDGPAKVGK